MKNKILLLALLLLFTQGAWAQIMFERTYGGSQVDCGTDVQQTFDNGYIIAGGTTSYGAGSDDIYLIKTNDYGDTLWTKTYGGSAYDLAYKVIQTKDGGYIIAGTTSSIGAGASDGYLIRTDLNGDTLWTKTLGGNQDEYAMGTVENDDGSIVSVGTTHSFTSGVSAIYVNKLDSNGVILWSKVYEKLNKNSSGSITKKINGYYYILGSTYEDGFPMYSQLYLLKINDTGDTLWTKTYNNPNGGLRASSIIVSPDNYLISSGIIEYPNSEVDLFLLKCDLSGNVSWFKTYGGAGYQGGAGLDRTSDNGFILTGVTGDITKSLYSSINNNFLFAENFEKGWTNGDLYLIKTNSNGDSLWSRTYGGAGDDYGNSVRQTNDNGFIICGGKSNTVSGKVYLIKTNDLGFTSIPDEEKINTEIVLYPNPNNGVFKILSRDNNIENVAVEVINCYGQVILCKGINLKETNEFDLTGYGKGVFFIHINGNGFSVCEKITIQ